MPNSICLFSCSLKGLRYHTYLPLGVVPADDPLSKCPAHIVGTGAGQTPLVPTGATPPAPPLVLLLHTSTVHSVVVIILPAIK